MASSGQTSQTELRLVLLGRSRAGRSIATEFILGRQAAHPQAQTAQAPQTPEPQDQPQTPEPQAQPPPASDAGADGEGAAALEECVKLRGMAAGRQVAVVDTPDWLSSERPLEERRRLVSSCAALSAPGPHAFVLCVPADQGPLTEEEAALGDLEVLESVLGPWAVRGHTLVLFTHAEQLTLGLEEHLTSRRPDLLELVARCGDRYHALERGGGGGGVGGEEEEGRKKRSVEEEGEERRRRRSVAELLERVLEMGRASGEEFYSCPLFQQAEARVRERQRELVRQRGEGGGGGEEELEDEEEMERVREEAELSVNDLDVDLDDIPPSTSSSSLSPSPPPSPPSSSSSWLWGLWAWLSGWLRAVPGLVRLEALLGSVVGLFVGGPVGGALGAAVRSVTTEVGKRKIPKTQKNK